jgi:hypothetical protein
VHEVAQVAQDIHAATRSLLHRGTPEQLAESQQLLEETRRALYLILAGTPEAATSEPSETSETSQMVETAEPATPPEID